MKHVVTRLPWDKFQHILGRKHAPDAPVGAFGVEGDIEIQIAYLAGTFDRSGPIAITVDPEILALVHYIEKRAPQWVRRDLRSRLPMIAMSGGVVPGGRGDTSSWAQVLSSLDRMLMNGPRGEAVDPEAQEQPSGD